MMHNPMCHERHRSKFGPQSATPRSMRARRSCWMPSLSRLFLCSCIRHRVLYEATAPEAFRSKSVAMCPAREAMARAQLHRRAWPFYDGRRAAVARVVAIAAQRVVPADGALLSVFSGGPGRPRQGFRRRLRTRCPSVFTFGVDVSRFGRNVNSNS